ncbi:CO dehydrogenase/acetyl-CoA synthase subunit delta [Methanolapillus millepedarum]|uniref:Acetyl-CoA decarbonylase/synthase complex subunit delta n=1 Tax=Methanolapillus millepedarum TaxID=3028296 RepID=A0AA96V302_9EURY|nr:hypothetical protein MsAc7_06650 [Methanosarcinaceae archaeon Ac7]
MTRKIKLSDLEKILKNLQSSDAKSIDADTLLSEMESGKIGTGKSDEALLAAQLSKASKSLGCAMDDELEILAQSSLPMSRFDVKPFDLFSRPIQEVVLGASQKEGGSRQKTITIGGERTMPYFFDGKMPHPNCVTMDVFDMPVSLAKSVRENYDDVINDPAEWAKKVVRDFGADMVTIHLISTDPNIKDTSAKDAAKTVEDVLQAVDVPIVIGGSGNPKKDPEVLEKAAEAAEGERVLIASANLNMDYQRIGNAAKKYGHVILSWTQMDINAQKELNRKLMRQCGISPDSLVMDPTTAALGYGLDYAYSNMERIRMAGLSGDKELAQPLSSGTTNAWGAREAWMISSPMPDDSDWGDRKYRGPIWEIITGLSLALAGNDLFMMMHPKAVSTLKQMLNLLSNAQNSESVTKYDDESYDAWMTEVYDV